MAAWSPAEDAAATRSSSAAPPSDEQPTAVPAIIAATSHDASFRHSMRPPSFLLEYGLRVGV